MFGRMSYSQSYYIREEPTASPIDSTYYGGNETNQTLEDDLFAQLDDLLFMSMSYSYSNSDSSTYYGGNETNGNQTLEDDLFVVDDILFMSQSYSYSVDYNSIYYGGNETNYPTDEPMGPTLQPTLFDHSSLCPDYNASNTNFAQQNYETCGIYACPGTELVIGSCDSTTCHGDQYLSLIEESGRLIAHNDDSCGLCSQIAFTTTGPCQTYRVQEGCYNDESCGGTVEVREGASYIPSALPSFSPTVFPTLDSNNYTSCPAYEASDTNYAQQNYESCGFFACPGTTFIIGSCDENNEAICTGDQFLSLYDKSNRLIAHNDDSCGLCSQISFTTTEPCQTYKIHEGCYNHESCGGIVTLLMTEIQPTREPTEKPTVAPTEEPTFAPTEVPTFAPTAVPTYEPTEKPTEEPTYVPTVIPTVNPTLDPTAQPSSNPTANPTADPTSYPTVSPTVNPTANPSSSPSSNPTAYPSPNPTSNPTVDPTANPTADPTPDPTANPTADPTPDPTANPTADPTPDPTANPTADPTANPTADPTANPTAQPSANPTVSPTPSPTTAKPTVDPTFSPTSQPSSVPTSQPSVQPTSLPTAEPSSLPSGEPTSIPSSRPTRAPITSRPTRPGETNFPTSRPSSHPSGEPTSEPTGQPSSLPSGSPTSPPSSQPSVSPSSQPSGSPTSQPSSQPTSNPTWDLRDWEEKVVFENYVNISNWMYSKAETSFMYSNFHYKGSNYVLKGNNNTEMSDGVTSCENWNEFSVSVLNLPFDYVYFSEISIFCQTEFYNLDSELSNLESITCSDRYIVADITDSMILAETGEFDCEGHIWRVQGDCNGGILLCVDCDKIVCKEDNSCPGYEAGVIINSCQDCPSHSGSFSVLTIDFGIDILYPQLNKPLVITSDRVTLDVELNVSAAGTYFCSSFKADEEVDIFSIISAGFSAVLADVEPSGSIVNILIDGLSPSSDYDIYCYTQDFNSHMMTLPIVELTRFPASTLCCRTIVFDTFYPASLTDSSLGLPYIFELSLDSYPNHDTNVFLNLVRTAAPICDINKLPQGCCDEAIDPNAVGLPLPTPNVFTFQTTSIDLKRTFSMSVKTPGCYLLTAHAEGLTDYVNVSSLFNIRSNEKAPDPPTLSKVTFSNDGRKLSLEMSQSTDQGIPEVPSAVGIFTCSELLSFSSSELAKCVWISDFEILVTLSDSGTLLQFGDIVTLINGNIKSCSSVNTALCSTANLDSFSTILPPLKPIVPIASLSTSSSIGPCDDIIIDPTSSSGKGGRPYTIVSWSLKGEGVLITPTNLTDIAEFLNSNYSSIDDLVNIPNYYLSSGLYHFYLNIMNWMNQESIVISTVEVTSVALTPRVSFAGPSSVISLRSTLLSLFTVAEVPSCAGNVNYRFFYEYQVYKGVNYIPEFQSSSLDARYFKLQPFNLAPATTYTAVVTVKVGDDSPTAPQSKSSVTIVTGWSGVKSIIIGGAFRTLSTTSIITVDGSNSYDLDYPTASNLTYVWSCIETIPNYGSDCNLNTIDMTADKLVLPKLTLTAESSYLFSLTVSNVGGKIDSSSTTLGILAGEIPKITIAAPSKSKFNTGDKITLSGTIDTVAVGFSLWDSLTLVSQGLSLVDYSLIKTDKVLIDGYNLHSIAIPPNSFTPGQTYIFVLGASYTSATSMNSYSTVSIKMNEPPANGIFTIEPEEGVAFNSTFFLSTKSWTDDVEDLPLVYVISYYSTSVDQSTTIKNSNLVSYIYTTLGQGLESKDFEVFCTVKAQDLFGSSASIMTTVIVTPPVDTAAVARAAKEKLDKSVGEGNPTAINAVCGAVTSSINAVDCSLADVSFCAAKNRNPCGASPNKCGLCLPSFLGSDGVGNSLCSDPTLLRPTGDDCSFDSNCLTDFCDNGKCTGKPQTCDEDCNGQGDCKFYDADKNEIDTCVIGDAMCKAECVCDDSFYGSSCKLDASQLDDLQALRETLCEGLYNTMNMQDVSADVIVARASSIASILSDVAQINENALSYCTSTLVFTIDNNPELAGETEAANLCATALSNVLQTSLPESLLNEVSGALKSLTDGMQAALAVGEPASELTTDSVRLSTSVSDSNSESEATTAQTDAEKFNGVAAPKIKTGQSRRRRLQSSGESTGLGITVVAFNNNPKGAAAVSDSTSVGLQTVQYFDDGNTRRRLSDPEPLMVSLLLTNPKPIEYYEDPIIEGEVICSPTKKENLQGYQVNVTCSRGAFLTFDCPGDSLGGMFNYTCPTEKKVPECTMWNEDLQTFAVNPTCTVTDFTAWNTTCLCESGSSAGGRRLSSVDSGLEEFGSSAAIIGASFLSTYASIADLTLEDLLKNLVILITMFTILGLTIGGLVLFAVIDMKEKNVADSTVKHDEKDTLAIYDVHDFFNSLLPDEYQGHSWFKQLWNKCLSEHDWLCVVLPYEEGRDFRSVRWVCAMCRIINFMFIDTILASLFFADDGTCQSYTTFRDCDLTYSLNQVDHLCIWDKDFETCSFREPSSDFVATMILTCILTTLAIPFDNFCIAMVHKVSEYANTAIDTQKTADGVAQAHDVKHELYDLQTYTGTLMRAARITKMKNTMDDVSVEDELVYLQNNHFDSRQIFSETQLKDKMVANIDETPKTLNFFQKIRGDIHHWLQTHAAHAGDTDSAKEIIKHGKLSLDDRFLIHKLRVVRANADKIIGDLESLPDGLPREIHLIQHFVVDNLSGLSRKLSYRFFFADFEEVDDESTKIFWRRVNLVGLPFYIFAVCLYIFLFGVKIGAKATNMWLIGCITATCIDVGILQPMKIWMRFIVMSAASIWDVRVTHGLLRDRAKSIMLRKDGHMRTANALVQHFNPACRAARKFPHLAASRLLLSLNDQDLPKKYVKKNNVTLVSAIAGGGFMVVVAMLFFMTLAPEAIADSLMEVVVTNGVNFSILGLAILANTNVSLPILFIIAVSFILWYRERVRYQTMHLKSKYERPIDAKDELDEEYIEKVSIKKTENKKRFLVRKKKAFDPSSYSMADAVFEDMATMEFNTKKKAAVKSEHGSHKIKGVLPTNDNDEHQSRISNKYLNKDIDMPKDLGFALSGQDEDFENTATSSWRQQAEVSNINLVKPIQNTQENELSYDTPIETKIKGVLPTNVNDEHQSRISNKYLNKDIDMPKDLGFALSGQDEEFEMINKFDYDNSKKSGKNSRKMAEEI
jgi:hypothetical protein